MSIAPKDWNIVILGRWNTAILTPAGIQKHVFKLTEMQGIEVSVPIDGISPYIIKHPKYDIHVTVDATRIQIQLRTMTYDLLEKAMAMGTNVLESLPETPVSASGINIKFGSQGTELARLSTNSFDNDLSDLGYVISARNVTKSLVFNAGKLNVIVNTSEQFSEIIYNFHLESLINNQQREWLRMPVAGIEAEIKKIHEKLHFDIEELQNDAPRE